MEPPNNGKGKAIAKYLLSLSKTPSGRNRLYLSEFLAKKAQWTTPTEKK